MFPATSSGKPAVTLVESEPDASKPGRRRRASSNTQLVIAPGAVAPVAQLRLLHSTEWEKFVEECCLTLEATKYEKVKHLGMPGDKGRDVEAIVSLPRVQHGWDLYQCKHYKDPVSPSAIFPEMAKFFGHLAGNSYPEPRTYYICAPQDCGVELHDLLSGKPGEFRAAFLEAWRKGSRGLKTTLTPQLEAVVGAFDFGRFKELPCRDLVKMHAADKAAHYKRFGIKPRRGADDDAPKSPTKKEEQYIAQLLAVYSEHAGNQIQLKELPSDYEEHLLDCRSEFYSAVGLERFSRDVFPGEFDVFLSLMLKTVKSATSLPTHKSGFERLNATVDRSHQFSMPESPLSESFRPPDMPGACHHLANAGKLKWVK